jgi:hypothetical protein
MNGLLDDIIQQGIASYGARYAQSPSEPLEMKGKGYFGMLPASDGFSTEISMTDDAGRSFPALVPTLTQEEVNYLMKGNEPTADMYRKAELFANYRQSQGMSPFASPTELRMPVGLLGY